MNGASEAIDRDGFAVVEGVITGSAASTLLAALGAVDESSEAAIQRRGSVHAIRNLLEVVPEVQALARAAAARGSAPRWR